MGLKKDLYTHELKLRALYPLDTPEGVNALLSDIHHVKSARFYKGDISACNLLIDLLIATREIKFTPRQLEALYLVFILDFTQREAAQIMNCTQQAVQQFVWGAVRRIARQYSKDIGEVLGNVEDTNDEDAEEPEDITA